MTHDPMCPWRGYERAPGDVCWCCDTCRLIAEVRADQDRRHAAAAEKMRAACIAAVEAQIRYVDNGYAVVVDPYGWFIDRDDTIAALRKVQP